MNLRVDAGGAAVIDGDQTEIGGNERYIALCRRHFSEARRKHFTEAMAMSDAALYVPLADVDLRLEPMVEGHRERLRRACAEDGQIWESYSANYGPDGFDRQFGVVLGAVPVRRCYAIFLGQDVVGMTGWIAHGAPGWSIEIGNSYIVPRLRGSGLNRRVKTLLLDHAFACGIDRVSFVVDAINSRSRAAVLKLGAIEEGILRHERRTWTGRVRDTVVFSILRDEWNPQV